MKIEKGKCYSTRNGTKVIIYETDNTWLDAIYGASRSANGWVPRTWGRDGKYCGQLGGSVALDIVEIWAEPEPRLEGWVNVYAPGSLGVDIWKTKKDADEDAVRKGRIKCVKMREVRFKQKGDK